MSTDEWVQRHQYLQPIAELQGLVEATLDEISIPDAPVPQWAAYACDYYDGMSLLQSRNADVDLRPAAGILKSFLKKLATRSHSARRVIDEIQALNAELQRSADEPSCAVTWLLDSEEFASAHPGLLRYLGWTALARYLFPVVKSFQEWRDEDRWLRHYCPTCGSSPVMAQLVGIDPGRLRFLTCSCGTRWRYRRTGCPFCDAGDDHRLSIVEFDGESGLRIDYCEYCNGYLKTYNGQGTEGIFLADWTSIHLDIIARDRGLERRGSSLYQI